MRWERCEHIAVSKKGVIWNSVADATVGERALPKDSQISFDLNSSSPTTKDKHRHINLTTTATPTNTTARPLNVLAC
jgi:hypothetical protein